MALQSLEDRPAFDPMTEAFWTPAMVLAWIIWRDPAAVARHSAPERKRGVKVWTRALTMSGVATRTAVAMATGTSPKVEVEQARTAFARALSDGTIKMRAIDVQTRESSQIAPAEFPYLAFGDESNDLYAQDEDLAYTILRYRRPLLPRDEVVAAWPAETSKNLASDVAKTKKMLVEAMLASPDRSVRTKDGWYARAKAEFGVSRKSFNSVWAAAIAETGSRWALPGRKSANRIPHAT